MIRIANGAGFLGDNLDEPQRLAEAADVDYLTLEYLAELTLSILAVQRERDPNAGFAGDLLDVLRTLCPAIRARKQLRIITNGGGMNPPACARRAAEILGKHDLGDVPIGVVTGDDLLPRLADLQAAGCEFVNLDTRQPLRELAQPVVSANAYLGAAPIAAALGDGARLVITGRVADASLTVGPAMHEFGWSWTDWNRLATASVAGHLIECGAQATGGYSVAWQDRKLAAVGYPIAELSADGEVVITKLPGTDGIVSRHTVAEQLVYEIGDPEHYLTPDVDCDFTTVELHETGPDRVAVSGASGRSAPRDLKVSLAYRDGFTASGQLLVYGSDCIPKARACADLVFARLQRAGFTYARANVELLGTGEGVPGLLAPPVDLRELVVRLTVHDPRREAVERFTKELAPLITSGPAGLAGYAAARSPVRPVFAYWPTLVPREHVTAKHEVRPAREWLVY